MNFKETVYWLGSNTPDNIACIEEIDYGITVSTATSKNIRALYLKRNKEPLANILNCAEGCPIPKQLSEYYPNLTQKEWDAILRTATLVFSALEQSEEV